MTQVTDPAPRMRAEHREMVPRALIRAIVALVVLSLGIATFARLTDRPLVGVPPATPVVAERALVIDAKISGEATVRSPDGTLIAEMTADNGGFVSVMHRVLKRERMKHGVPQDGPVLLQLNESRRYTLIDPSTGWSADLMSFGKDNIQAFARLLDQP